MRQCARVCDYPTLQQRRQFYSVQCVFSFYAALPLRGWVEVDGLSMSLSANMHLDTRTRRDDTLHSHRAGAVIQYLGTLLACRAGETDCVFSLHRKRYARYIVVGA